MYIKPYDEKSINTSAYEELTSTQYINKNNIFKDILLIAALYDFAKVERQIKLNNKTYKICNLENAIKSSKDKKIILIDDIIDTAGTLCNAANAIVEKGGAKEVYAYVAHGVLSGNAIERLKNSVIKKVVFLNTIDIPKEKMLDKFAVLNVAPILSEAIKRINKDMPISAMILE